jgi:hypothetical protein
MGGYLSWIAGRYEELQKHLRDRVDQLRNHPQYCSLPIHARLPTTIAELQSGWEIWLEFAREVGGISRAEHEELEARCRKVLHELAATQLSYQQASDPALHFLTILQAALASGRAHVADRRGRVPDSPERWGWRKSSGPAWVPQGERIGWLRGSELFLEPEASYRVAQSLPGAVACPSAHKPCVIGSASKVY